VILRIIIAIVIINCLFNLLFMGRFFFWW